MAIYEIAEETSADQETMPFGELVAITGADALIEAARDISTPNFDTLFRKRRALSDKLTVNLLLQLAKYKFLRAHNALAAEIPDIARCENEDEFVTAFYGIGNTLRQSDGSQTDDIGNVAPEALIGAAINALELREEIYRSNRSLSRFLLFNAVGNASLAVVKYEHDKTADNKSSLKVALSDEAAVSIAINFTRYSSALDYSSRYLDLGAVSDLQPHEPVLFSVPSGKD